MPHNEKYPKPKALVFVSQNSAHSTRQVGHGVDSRKQVREHAAKVSAAKRLATIAKRRSEDRSVFPQTEQGSSSKAPRSWRTSPPDVSSPARQPPLSASASSGVVKSSSRKSRSRRASSGVSLSQTEPQSILSPDIPPEIGQHRYLSAVVDRFFQSALSALDASHLAYDKDLLNAQAFTDQIYSGRKSYQGAAGSLSSLLVQQEHDNSSQAVLQWQGYNLINYLQASMGSNVIARTASIGTMAVLAGWQFEFGEREAYEMNLHDLSKLMCMFSDATNAPDVVEMGPFPAPEFGHHRALPIGFQFYNARNLLPRTLIYIVGTITLFDPQVPLAFDLLRQLQLAIQACRPEGDVALRALSEEALSVQIAKHVQIAGYVFGNELFKANYPDGTIDIPANDIVAEKEALSSSALIGTVYDEILLWCLWIMCSPAPQFSLIDVEHIQSFKQLTERLELETFESLVAVISKYGYPQWSHENAKDLWAHFGRNEKAMAQAPEG